jgi:hypothetical protein
MSEMARQVAKKNEAKKENSIFRQQETDFSNSLKSPADQIIFLQRTAGNQAVQHLLKSRVLQAKLKISRPNDVYEQEADRVAEQVMNMPDPKIQRQQPHVTPLIQRQVLEEKEEIVQAKNNTGQSPTVTPSIESRISELQSGGQPLDPATRAFFEPRFGQDFSGVRIYTDAKAAEVVNAKAFTVGQNITFGAGKYSLESSEGRRLLAHELTHVVQQRSSTAIPSNSQIGLSSSTFEHKAEPSYVSNFFGQQVSVLNSTGPLIQRVSVNNANDSEYQHANVNSNANAVNINVLSFMAVGLTGTGISREPLMLLSISMQSFLSEMNAQISDPIKREVALKHLEELQSPSNASQFIASYFGGLVGGIISPLTSLFDITVFVENLNNMAYQLARNIYTNSSELVAEAQKLAMMIFELDLKLKEELTKLNKLDTIIELLKFADEKVIQAAEKVGSNAAKSVVESLERIFEDKREESWYDILTTRKEGESITMPLSLVNSLIERSKSKIFSTPWSQIGYYIGYAIGAAAIGIVLFATTEGIGNAITAIGTALGRIAPVLGRAVEAIKIIGKAIAAVEDGIALVTKVVLKPLEPLLDLLGPLFFRLRAFLRKLLGLADEEAGSTAALMGKSLHNDNVIDLAAKRQRRVANQKARTQQEKRQRRMAAGAENQPLAYNDEEIDEIIAEQTYVELEDQGQLSLDDFPRENVRETRHIRTFEYDPWVGDSTLLGERLSASGIPKTGPNYEAHHIIPSNEPNAERLRAFLRKRGFKDINHPDNGVWLPRGFRTGNIEGEFIHDFTFEREYFERLEEILMRDPNITPSGIHLKLRSIRMFLKKGRLPSPDL